MLAAGFLLAGLVAAPPAHLMVLGSVIGEGDSPLSALDVEGAARETASFVLGREVRARDADSARIESEVRACDGEMGCAARVLRQRGVSELLWLIVDTGEPSLLTGKLLGADGRVRATSLDELELSALRAERVKVVSGDLILRAGLKLGGRVQAVLQPPDARLQISGRPGPLATETLLPAAVYLLLAEKPGYQPARLQVQVLPCQVEQVRLELVPEDSILSSPWLWVAIGAVVLAGAGTMYAFTQRGAELCVPGTAPECQR